MIFNDNDLVLTTSSLGAEVRVNFGKSRKCWHKIYKDIKETDKIEWTLHTKVDKLREGISNRMRNIDLLHITPQDILPKLTALFHNPELLKVLYEVSMDTYPVLGIHVMSEKKYGDDMNVLNLTYRFRSLHDKPNEKSMVYNVIKEIESQWGRIEIPIKERNNTGYWRSW